MGRRRRRSRGDRISRRRFLAGGLLGIGGASILGGTQAFSQVDATRGASVQTAGDENALLGVDPVTSVQQGDTGVNLVTLTNNTDATLALSVVLDDPSQGQLTNATPTLASSEEATVIVDVDADSPTGSDALAFSVSAAESGDGDFSVSLERAVAVTEGPELLQQVNDQTQNGNAAYEVSYHVRNVATFDQIEIVVENVDNQNRTLRDTYTRTSTEGTVSYPGGGDSDGGVDGQTYEVRFRVYDADGRVTALDTTVSDNAGGSNPPGDDLGGPNSSTLDSFTVQDDSQDTNTDLTMTYRATDNGDFDHVSVTFDNQNHDWSDATETRAATSGSVDYSHGGTMGQPYEITVEVVNPDGITVDSESVTYTPDGGDWTSWP